MTLAPRVSFVVPCYQHGHFLAECVGSILGQSYTDLEVLIMDDCSPDDTMAIARTFTDPRVRHIRNEQNLGHLANYNKGIGLARGEFIWLINVDDYLRRPYVLQRFISALDRHPSAAYVFCPAVAIRGRTEDAPHGVHGPVDRVFAGNDFVKRLLIRNCVPTPAVMVRRTSYQRVGLFARDLPHSADWFQWCRYALHGDVAYVAEPMVCYRIHDTNMSTFYLENPIALVADEMRVRFRVKDIAAAAGRTAIVRAALDNIANDYGTRVALHILERWTRGLTFDQFEASLREQCHDPREAARITGRVLCEIGDAHYARGHLREAQRYYWRALRCARFAGGPLAKIVLLRAGAAGRRLRIVAARVRSKPTQARGVSERAIR